MPALRNESHAHVTPTELLARIRAGTAPIILDVRSRWEFERGHVLDAMHIPFWALPARARRLAGVRDEPVVVYCGHGPRAAVAAALLRLLGFSRVLCLKGHMSGWRRANLPEDTARG